MTLKLFFVLGALVLAACAGPLSQTPTRFAAAPSAETFTFPSAIARRTGTPPYYTIPAGSTWQRSGRIAEGSVYARRGGVFQVSGQFLHEAALVVAGGQVIGFYLLASQAFTPLAEPIPVPPQQQ